MRPWLIHTFNFLTSLIKYAIILLAVLVFLLVILLVSTYQDLSGAAKNGLAGKNLLTAAASEISARNWDAALKKTTASREKFTAALDNVNKIKNRAFINKVAPLKSQANDLGYLLQTAEILSRSLERIIPLAQEVDGIRSGSRAGDFASLPPTAKEHLLKLIYESEPELNGLKANLDLAILNLDKIHKIGILWPVYKQISDIKQELIQASSLLNDLRPLARLLPVFAGYPETSRFLLILQNNDELRPTGGFIGVYGILKSQGGEIISLKTDDSYHLDMPAVGKWNLEPPTPIKKYLKVSNWYLRDANWSPDWPTAAQDINRIYQGESQTIGQPAEPLTGLMAITPDFVADLIRLVGPITVRGETYTADNFQPLLQYNVEVAYKDQNISSWDRKEIINELLAEMKQRLFSLPSARWAELLKLSDRNIAAKNIQIYFTDPAWETLAVDLKADGKIKTPNQDYLLVVDSNLGAFKTDAVIKKTITYAVNQTAGELKATLKLTYTHEGGFDWRTTRYRSYTRVYVPRGSQLISIDGLNDQTADITTTDDELLNKTVFGFFLSVEPKTKREVTVNYNLPNNWLNNGQYELLVQKQAGRRTESLKVNLNSQGKEIRNWQANLDTDQWFSLK